MHRRTVWRSAAAIGAGGTVAMFGAFPAQAAAGSQQECQTTVPTSTLIDGVCQVVITDSGTYTFPTAIGKLSAVLVGGGGGGMRTAGADPAYVLGGGGGEVVYVDSVVLGSPVSIEVGAGGIGGVESEFTDSPTTIPGADGGDTLLGGVVAHGGHAATVDGASHQSGDSGNGNSGATGGDLGTGETGVAGGAGAAGDAPTKESSSAGTGEPGPGYLLSSVPGVDTALFPPEADGGVIYGAGGSALDAAAGANSGAGGSGLPVSETEPAPAGTGQDGVVILRYAPETVAPPSSTTPVSTTTSPPSPPPTAAHSTQAVPSAAPNTGGSGAPPSSAHGELADTGTRVNVGGLVGGGVVGALIGGIMMIGSRSRRRRESR